MTEIRDSPSVLPGIKGRFERLKTVQTAAVLAESVTDPRQDLLAGDEGLSLKLELLKCGCVGLE